MIDGYGRKIDYMRISLTDLCNLRCRYCIPEQGVEKKHHTDILRFEEILDIVKAGVSLGITKIRLTGGEPLVRKGVISLISSIRGIGGVEDINLTTNATLLGQFASALKDAGLSRVNISLDTLDKQKYAYITRGGDIEGVLQGIEEAKKAGLMPIKINVVLIKGFNDDEIDDFVHMTVDEDIDVRFIELMPIGECASFVKGRQMPVAEVLMRFPELVPEHTMVSQVSADYRLPGAKGKVGLITPVNHKFCSCCNRIRITADGKIKPCLHSSEEIDIRTLKNTGHSYQEILELAIMRKPHAHRLDDEKFIERGMNSIGG